MNAVPHAPHRWRLPLVLLAGALTHCTYVANGFTFQDHGDIEARRTIRSLPDLPHALVERWGDTGFYRPLVTSVHSVDHALYGLWAPGYHLTNILLHLALLATMWLFAAKYLGLTSEERTVAGLVAAVHPVTWIVVGGITYRQELLVALLTLLAVALHIRAGETGRWWHAVQTASAFALALLSKETALAWFPALVGTWEITAGRGRRHRTRLLMMEGAVIGVYATLRAIAVPDRWRVAPLDLAVEDAIGTRLLLLGRLLKQLVVPVLPSYSDATPVVSWAHPAALVALVVVIAAAGMALRSGLRSVAVRVLLFCGVALAPALHLIPLPRFASPHYAHLATVGAGFWVALLWGRWAPRAGALGTAARMAVIAWLSVAGVVTIAGGPRFVNDLALFAPEVRADPDFVEGHMFLGMYYMSQDKMEQAEEAFAAALLARPRVIAYRDDVLVFVGLARVRIAQGRAHEAEALLAQAAQYARPSLAAGIAFNRASLAARRGDDAEVMSLLAPHADATTTAEPLLLLARSLGRLGRRHEAVATLRRALPYVEGERRQRLEQLVANATTP